MRWHVVVEEGVGAATQLANQHLTIEVIAAFGWPAAGALATG